MSTLDVRKKVSSERLAGTHERLRADHIQMMEMLQRTQDSNAKLELELETLRAQLGDSAGKPIDDELSAEVLKSEVVALRDKVKELELANLCLGRMHEGTIENLQNHSKIITGKYDNVKAEKELLLEKLTALSSAAKPTKISANIVRPLLANVKGFNKMLREDVAGMRADVAIHAAGLNELLDGWKQSWAKRQTASCVSTGSVARKFTKKPGRIMSDSDGDSTQALGGSMSTSSLSRKEKEKEKGGAEAQKQVEELRRKLSAITGECQKLTCANRELGEEVQRLTVEVGRLSRLAEETTSRVAHTQMPTAPPAAEKSTEGQALGQGDFSFEAFIKLKKENKELKLEVLKLSGPHPKLNRGSSKGRT